MIIDRASCSWDSKRGQSGFCCGYASFAGYRFKEVFPTAVYGFAVLIFFQILRAEAWEAVQMLGYVQGCRFSGSSLRGGYTPCKVVRTGLSEISPNIPGQSPLHSSIILSCRGHREVYISQANSTASGSNLLDKSEADGPGRDGIAR